MLYTIKNDLISVTVRSDGGSMASIKYLPENEERQWQGGKAWQGQDVVIFPIVGHAEPFEVCGKIFTPKSHGIARYNEFALVEKTETSLMLSLCSSEQTLKDYPYEFNFLIAYELNANSVQITYTVIGKNGKIPFYVGGHAGMKAPGGEAIIEFENTENPVLYPLQNDKTVQLKEIKRFVANKAFFKECKTFQLGNLSGGAIYAYTQDGYKYTYMSDCPLFAFWSNEDEGDYICVEPWWGINDYPQAPRDITLKPFINFADERGRKFSYTLSIEKV